MKLANQRRHFSSSLSGISVLTFSWFIFKSTFYTKRTALLHLGLLFIFIWFFDVNDFCSVDIQIFLVLLYFLMMPSKVKLAFNDTARYAEFADVSFFIFWSFNLFKGERRELLLCVFVFFKRDEKASVCWFKPKLNQYRQFFYHFSL